MISVFACLLLMLSSFVFSSSEIAIFSLSRVQLKKIKNQSELIFHRVKILLQDSIGFLITILFFNELINISLGALITAEWIDPLLIPSWWEMTSLPSWAYKTILGVLVTTPLIMIFCELTPKVLASKVNHIIVSLFLPIVYSLYRLMKPLVSFIKLFLPKQPTKDLHHLEEDDFLIIAEEQTETGDLHETELELIKNVFEMDDTLVELLSTPIKKIITIPSTFTLEQAAQVVLKEKVFSRIPIHGKNKDEIVGVLNTKDLVELKVNPDAKNESVMTIAKEPLIISHQTHLDTLFRKMKNKKIQVAFIRNQQQKITGMISIQDILEAVIEEAFEE